MIFLKEKLMKKLLLIMAIASLAACATSSKEIAAIYVSPIQYSSYDCEQLGNESKRLQGRVSQLGGLLDKQASDDGSMALVSAILFWPAAFAIDGDGQQQAEYARLKGEYEAIEQASIQKKCL